MASQAYITAIHEAAHAVVAHQLGLRVTSADIIKVAGRSGRCVVSEPNTRAEWQAWGVQALAGMEAERIILGIEMPSGGLTDRTRFVQHLGAERIELFHASAVVAVVTWRRSILRVAAALLREKQLDGTELCRLI